MVKRINSTAIVLVLAFAFGMYLFSEDSLDPDIISGKRVLITGASSGIGEQLAYEYSKLGARVMITARRVKLLQAVAERCKELGAGQVVAISSDLGDPSDRIRIVEEVKMQFGGLDQLVVNHAILHVGYWLGSEENMTSLEHVLNVNFVSYVHLTSLALDLLMESGGSVGVVSSVGGVIALATQTPYVTAKFALQGFYRAFQLEMEARNVGVSTTLCVIGFVDTDIGHLNEGQRSVMNLGKFVGFVESPQNTAMAILRGISNRKAEIHFGHSVTLVTFLHKLFPKLIERMASLLFRFMFVM